MSQYGYHVLWHHSHLDSVREKGLLPRQDDEGGTPELHFVDNENHAKEYEGENTLTVRFPRFAAGVDKENIWPSDRHWTTDKVIHPRHIEYRDRTTGTWKPIVLSKQESTNGTHTRLSEYLLSQKDPLKLLEKIIQKTLNPKFWDQKVVPPKLDKKVRDHLINVAMDFCDGIDAQGFEPEDIILTGSSANYNWTPQSDVDVHIVVDYSNFGKDREMTKEYFLDLCMLWNEHHKVKIYGHELEMFVQDKKQEATGASGIYSLKKNKWVRKPKKVDEPDLTVARAKAKVISKQISGLKKLVKEEKYAEAYDKIYSLREKIRNMRTAGLIKGGEYSQENLAFKILRHEGALEDLWNISILSYDKSKSLYLSEMVTLCRGMILELSSAR